MARIYVCVVFERYCQKIRLVSEFSAYYIFSLILIFISGKISELMSGWLGWEMVKQLLHYLIFPQYFLHNTFQFT